MGGTVPLVTQGILTLVRLTTLLTIIISTRVDQLIIKTMKALTTHMEVILMKTTSTTNIEEILIETLTATQMK